MISRQLRLLKLDSASNNVKVNPIRDPVLTLELSSFVLDSTLPDLAIYIDSEITLENISNRLINQNVTPPGPSFVGLVTINEAIRTTKVIIATSHKTTNNAEFFDFIRYKQLSHICKT